MKYDRSYIEVIYVKDTRSSGICPIRRMLSIPMYDVKKILASLLAAALVFSMGFTLMAIFLR